MSIDLSKGKVGASEIIKPAPSEVSAGTHSPFCLNLADIFACVPPHQSFKGAGFLISIYMFSDAQINRQNAWDFLFALVRFRNNSGL